MQLIALIPARFASTRFPGKPLADVLGQPLIQRVYEQVQRVPGLDGLYVATDDARINDVVKNFGGQVVMTRPDHPLRQRPPGRSRGAAGARPRGHRGQHPGGPARVSAAVD